MSKVLTSEFSTWESLYWPEGIPRSKSSEIVPKTIVERSLSAAIQTKDYKLEPASLKNLLDEILRTMDQSKTLQTSTSDQLGILIGILASFSSEASLILSRDAAAAAGPDGVEGTVLNRVASTHDPLKDFKVQKSAINNESLPSSSAASGPLLTLIFPDQARIAYSQRELASAVESLNTFLRLSGDGSIAIVGSLQTEFVLNAVVSSLASGASLLLADNLSDLKGFQLDELRSVFIGRAVINEAGADKQLVEFGKSQLRAFRNSISSIIVDGPVSTKFTKDLEKATHIPVLQVYGISGRGIIMANPSEFNVHGSVGIPITNAEAVISDNYEGNWMRDRMLMGPGVEGEVIIRGSFVNQQRQSGDARQTSVKAQILGQSLDWLATGLTGKMDENGFFYLYEPCFR